MNQAYWRQRWQEHRIGFHRPDVHPRLPAFWDRLQVAQGGTVFVPLCGKSLDLLWLVEQGYRVRGVELSPIAVQEFFQEHHLHPQVDSVGAFQRWQAGPVESKAHPLPCPRPKSAHSTSPLGPYSTCLPSTCVRKDPRIPIALRSWYLCSVVVSIRNLPVTSYE